MMSVALAATVSLVEVEGVFEVESESETVSSHWKPHFRAVGVYRRCEGTFVAICDPIRPGQCCIGFGGGQSGPCE